ncbi:MAG: hypothetical protein AAF693_12865 [Bacteroidota bacterium]
MINKRSVLPIFLALTSSSCFGPKVLYNGLTRHSYTLGYLHDSPLDRVAKSDTIRINVPEVSDSSFTLCGTLLKEPTHVVPAIIYTGWKSTYHYSIGHNVINEAVDVFTRAALIDEFNRSTSLYADSLHHFGYQLDITIDRMEASGPYDHYGEFLFLIFWLMYDTEDHAGPGSAYSRLSYVLKNGDQVLSKGSVENEAVTAPLKKRIRKLMDYRRLYTSQLTEALSFTLKANIESIVNEVNAYVIRNPVR